jgi:hypothetical protein
MKMGEQHLVPLSQQALTLLEDLKSITGNGRHLFRSLRSADRPISDNTVNAALRRLGPRIPACRVARVIILDTNIVTEPMKADGNSRVRNWLDDQIAETLYLTSISLSELLLAVQVLLGTSPSKPLHGGRSKV